MDMNFLATLFVIFAALAVLAWAIDRYEDGRQARLKNLDQVQRTRQARASAQRARLELAAKVGGRR